MGGECGRVHAGGERAELLEHAVDVACEPLEHLACAGRALDHHLLGELEADAQRDEPLLPPVVEVALDPAALVVGRREDARPGPLQLVVGRVHALGEALVLVPDEREAADRLEERPLLVEPGVVDERGNRARRRHSITMTGRSGSSSGQPRRPARRR